MQLICRHCQQTVDFSGPRPANCLHCGQALIEVSSDATLDYRPSTDVDVDQAKPASCGVLLAGLEVNERIGNYRLLRTLGQGGMGVVWEAEQSGTGRRVALKLLSPRLRPTRENVERFLREGKSAASISHPRSTFIFDAGEQQGQPYIAMELMPGCTLKDELDESGPFAVERAVDCILDAIEGLEAAHALGVVHRDVKPSNCFIDSDGRVKIGDFGLSKSLVSDAQLTQTGAFLGTPQFAAPEQVRGGAVDQRTDVYAVGATLFCLLAGHGPFVGDAAAVIAQIVSDPPPELTSLRPDVRPSLSRIVGRTLEKDPARRYKNLAGLRRALVPFATGGVSIADIGRRLAGYMLDSLVVGTVSSLVAFVQVIWTAARGGQAGVEDASAHYSPTTNAIFQAGALTLSVLYFTVTEAVWGRGVGKQLMGLRVIGPDGDRPGFARALVRSLFVPGACGLALLAPLLQFVLSSAADAPSLSPPALPTVVGSALPVVFVLLCLTTMRMRNGYRGLHELVSGTRVVRPRTAIAARKQRLPVVVPVVKTDEARRFGPFRARGDLGRSGAFAVIEARDELLDRAVWIFLDRNGAGVLQERRTIARPSRPHWLQGGDSADGHWDAFEAVTGAPLTHLARQAAVAWQDSRFWLLDLSEELLAATADGSLPESLTLEQLWIARGGRLKLLDAPVTPVGTEMSVARSETGHNATQTGHNATQTGHNATRTGHNAAQTGHNATQTGHNATQTGHNATQIGTHAGPVVDRAIGLFREAFKLATQGQVLPFQVRQFADELAKRSTHAETLVWASGQLREVVKQPAVLGWDQRLGVLAVSMGTEFSLYLSVAVGMPWLMIGPLHWSLQQFALGIPLVLLAPALLSLAFRGGPAFWLTRIDVLRSDGRRAGRWRCAVRGLLAWTPMMVFYMFLGVLLGKIVTTTGNSGVQLTDYQFNSNEPVAWFFLGGICGGELLLLLFLIGAIYAILRPQRGFQDVLAGTWLAPR